ncbi:hypothetical protein PGB90_003093 [Kerria lacca]
MRVIIIRILLVNLLLLTIYNEYVVYILKPFTTWPEIKCNNSEKCTKLLFVADPQILGDITENMLTRFDCDRYLRNTFSVALEYVKPDGVIFLGDLEDEGTLANEEQYEHYYNRFESIFQLKNIIKSGISLVFIPGDNDIGGENNEIIKAHNVNRFRKYFNKDDMSVIKNTRIIKINKLLRTYPPSDNKIPKKLNIAISHMPLTNVMSPFTQQVVQNIKPEFIFSAHEHKSYVLLTLKENGQRLYYEELKYNSYRNGVATWTFQTAESTNYSVITEIIVPTCSYRMGVFDMGYGVVTYGK